MALGLGCSLSWGVGDFLGGLQSRRHPLLAVLVVSNLTGVVAVAAAVVAAGAAVPAVADLLPAVAAGTAGVLALGAFYRALAIGTMSIVAPISATGVAVPVAVGLAGGEAPGALQVAGMAAAVVGVGLASREAGGEGGHRGSGVGLALLAALGFGAFFVGMDAAAEAGVLWAVLTSKSSALVLLGALILALGRRPGVPARALPGLAAVGLFDVAANGLFALASRQGLLSLTAVLSSLYPVVTVLLARAVLAERVRRVQEAGIALALGGVVLIAAG